jgi:hypothetical protein
MTLGNMRVLSIRAQDSIQVKPSRALGACRAMVETDGVV